MTTQAVSTRRLGATERRDRWWVTPVTIVTILTLFGIYSVVVAALNKDYLYTRDGARLLSPFYSPDLRTMFGVHIPFTYAFFVIWAPLGLRASCYYYRKAYYRSFFLAPPACSVSGPAGRKYTGETRLPFILNNVHRLFFYLASIVWGFLTYDVVRSFLYSQHGSLHFGIGLGSIIMLLNVIAIAGFTFGCNSFRHIVGGRKDCFTCSRSAMTQFKMWRGVSVLNSRHAMWAWISLFSVLITDLYIRLVSGGVFHDPHHIF